MVKFGKPCMKVSGAVEYFQESIELETTGSPI